MPDGPRQGLRRVAVTGAGIICSLGRGAREVWAALAGGRRGFSALTLFDPGGASGAPVAQVAGTFPASSRAGGRIDAFLSSAAEEAVACAGLAVGGLREFGISIGATNGGLPEAEEWYRRQIADAEAARPASAAPVLGFPSSSSTDRLAARFGARGPRITNTTACSASAVSIALAADLIRDGEAPGMVAGGGDPLCRLTYAGFGSLRLMDLAGCRPFDRDRKGLTLGEGAGILVLEDWERAVARGAAPLAEILDYGASCDAHHMTACHPEGRGMESAMREALARSGLAPAQVGYVNAHGTATPVNDAAEGRAIAAVFGGRSHPPISSTKSMYGHLLGGSGAAEAVTAVLCLVHGSIPPNAGLSVPDEGLDLDLVIGAAREIRVERVASNSFGFGGANVVLLFAAAGRRA